MQIVIVSRSAIDLALCANSEILASMPQILGSQAAPIVRALEEYRLGLRGMAPPGDLETAQWDQALIEEAIEANAAIAASCALACEIEQVAPMLTELVAKAFADFEMGLKTMGSPPKRAA